MIKDELREEFIRHFGSKGERTLTLCASPYHKPAVPTVERLAKSIDHTLLKSDATQEQVGELCAEAIQGAVASVCVNSVFVPFVRERLDGSAVAVCSVVGFPLGAMSKDTKACEAKWAHSHGAQEIDMVISLGALKAGEFALVVDDIRAVREAVPDGILKVILETALLTNREKVLAAWCSVLAKADYVKTSTGFSIGGATIADIKLLRAAVGGAALLKASGGIRTREDALSFLEAGADRLGASQTKVILGLS